MDSQEVWRHLNARIGEATDSTRPLHLRIDALRFAGNIALSFKDWQNLTNALDYVGQTAEEIMHALVDVTPELANTILKRIVLAEIYASDHA